MGIVFEGTCLAVALGALAATPAHGQERSTEVGAKFAKPVRLMAGEAFMGEGRLYPSPVFHDVNGDGLLDIVVGDLFGHLTVALRLDGAGPARYGAEEPLYGADGNRLKFHNW